jgi:hypothetical protein
MASLAMNGVDAAAQLLAANRSRETFQPTYLGLALLTFLLVLCLIKAYRVWKEIQDVAEPASRADLLESFERAYFAGEMDADEFERVRSRLTGAPEEGRASSAEAAPGQPPRLESAPSGGENADMAGAPGAEAPDQPMKDRR